MQYTYMLCVCTILMQIVENENGCYRRSTKILDFYTFDPVSILADKDVRVVHFDCHGNRKLKDKWKTWKWQITGKKFYAFYFYTYVYITLSGSFFLLSETMCLLIV